MSLAIDFLNKLRSAKQETLFESSNYWRLIKSLLPSSAQKVTNQKEIRVTGLKRTGNHAVIGWIRAQHPVHALHLNKCPPSKNPYQYLYKHYKNEMLSQAARGIFDNQSLLIISYENQKLNDIGSKHFERFHDVYVGYSEQKYDVLILRDPFNLMASQLKAKMCRLSDEDTNARPIMAATIMQLWLSYAKEFLGETDFLPYQKVPVNYNQWHLDFEYRKALAQRLKLNFTDAGRDKVRDYGGGSSFHGTNMTNQGSQMKVLERWHTYKSDDNFWKCFRNEEVIYYAEKIFGRDQLPLGYIN